MTVPRWWEDRAALARVVTDLLAAEFARLRPGGSAPPLPRPWPDGLCIDGVDAGGLGADSLDRLTLAGALNETLHLHRSGIEDYLLVRRRFGEWLEVAAEALARFDGELTFRTSGSTGNAKSCPHPLAALEEEADELAAIFAGRRRVVALVPAHHIYGFLFTVLVPARLAAAVTDGRDRSPGGVAAGLRPGDLVVAHPDWWGALLRSGAALPEDVVGSSSTAPCPPATAHALGERGLARLVEVFGSSETAGLGWRDDPDAPFQPFPWWRFGADGTVTRALPDGTTLGAALQDRLAFDGDGRFRPAGRVDTVVQVGGVNVSPSAVRAHLLTHPAIADCAVRPMRPEEGTRLKAFIVPAVDAPPEAELRRTLAAWIDLTLPTAERPRALTFGDRLPVNAMGKAADWRVADIGS